MLIRRVRQGPLSRDANAGLARLYTSAGAREEGVRITLGDNGLTLGEALSKEYEQSGATALNLRVNVLGIGFDETREQIRVLGAALGVIRERRLEVDVEDE